MGPSCFVGLFIYNSLNNQQFYIALSSSQSKTHKDKLFFLTSKNNFKLGKTYHLAATYDGESLELYINGKLAETYVVKDNLRKGINHGQAISIGQRFRDKGFKKGMVDELYIFNRELSDIEVDYLAGGTALATNLKSAKDKKALFEY